MPDGDIPPLFRSFFLGGFECSSHRRRDGRRLDLLATTGHDRLALADYQALRGQGIVAARDGLRWHRIETAPGRYDWSEFLPRLRAARASGVQVIWDLCHYGWPDDLDIWSPAFIDRFAAFAGAAARLVREEQDEAPAYCPLNEISYWAWAGGEMGHINPLARKRGGALKRQLVRATIAAIEAVRAVDPRVRIISAEPLIHVVARGPQPRQQRAAAGYRLSQYEALDLLSGRQEPELGGRADYLDILGVNFYPHNQWYYHGSTVPLGHYDYRPLSEMLGETYRRYGRPLLLAETGAEGSARPAWLHYVCDEVRDARSAGVPVGGICLYPVTDYPGWENDRLCRSGLFSEPDGQGRRQVHAPLAAELRRQQEIFRFGTEADVLQHG
ncbi:beta-glucosidase [Roseomonas marmotae]|uniref:Beta-glucosidase n=1 Tax=Roseomonas marmotae TaxID=2768161 RepID=A0ABS3KCP8_9PROT|nr:beta-glucosidase [Roseomonas marmotae]MBO1075222.1 beta-glucosidase [Roseomonas marmotae]QTI79672.1 beta-glucosidase [Roseomonas marmotae]